MTSSSCCWLPLNNRLWRVDPVVSLVHMKILLGASLKTALDTCVRMSAASLPALRSAWCWWGGPPPGGRTGRPESPTTERWCGHISLLKSYTGVGTGVKESRKRERETEREREGDKNEKDRKLLRLVLVHEGCFDLAGGGETEIISSYCSTSPLPSLQHTNCFLSQSVHRHAHKTLSQTEQHITDTSQPRGARMTFSNI